MVKTFDESEAVEIRADNGVPILVCPDCVEHAQGDPNKYLDCKNTFHRKGVPYAVGQCCCYSYEHGRTEA